MEKLIALHIKNELYFLTIKDAEGIITELQAKVKKLKKDGKK